jgi:hypothetical protein
MAQRPSRPLVWASAAASGDIVEPPSGLAAAGWAAGQKPPAPYFNFLLSLAGQWVEFLRGPNLGAWTRSAWATSPATFNAPTRLAFDVDTVTADGDAACYRFACVGEETGPTTALRVSQTGETWTRRTNVPSGMAAPFALHTDGVRWMLAGTTSGGYELHTTVVDDGSGVGAIGSGSGSWSGASFPSSPSEPKALASHGGRSFLLTASEGFYSDDSGQNWSAYSVSGTARSADGRDVVFDGERWVFITQSGQVYSSIDGAAFAYKSTLGISASWRLAAGEDGEVVAYRLGGSSSQNLYRSLNSGTTWTAETPAGDLLPTYLTELRYQDGAWVATSSAAPWLWTSTDLVSWLGLRTPAVPSSSSDLFALVFEGGRWLALGNGFALACGRAADPAPGPYVPGSLPAYFADAGYLRGLAVSSDAPSDGDVLTWDATAEEWVPEAPTGGGTDAHTLRGTAIDTVFSPTTGQVLTWSGSKWQPATPAATPTTVTFTAHTSRTFTPASFPSGVRFEGFVSGSTGRWVGSLVCHVYQSAGTYYVDGVDTSESTVGDITVTVNTSTGVITLTFTEAVTGRLIATPL